MKYLEKMTECQNACGLRAVSISFNPGLSGAIHKPPVYYF